MSTRLNTSRLSIIGLVLLGVVALGLSGAAVLQHRGTSSAEPAPLSPATTPGSSEPGVETPSTSEPGTEDPGTETPTPQDTPTSEVPSPSATPAGGPTVVIIGDSYSSGDPDTTWVGLAAEQLGWGEVINLSSPGRGFITSPRECDFTPCATFGGTVETIAAAAPDLVITFGGTADGDYALVEAAAEYFTDPRDALPEADLVAISPVTGGDEAPYWLTLHKRSVTAAVEAVDGRIIDVGQPGVGDGETLSAETQAEIAGIIVDELSE